MTKEGDLVLYKHGNKYLLYRLDKIIGGSKYVSQILTGEGKRVFSKISKEHSNIRYYDFNFEPIEEIQKLINKAKQDVLNYEKILQETKLFKDEQKLFELQGGIGSCRGKNV